MNYGLVYFTFNLLVPACFVQPTGLFIYLSISGFRGARCHMLGRRGTEAPTAVRRRHLMDVNERTEETKLWQHIWPLLSKVCSTTDSLTLVSPLVPYAGHLNNTLFFAFCTTISFLIKCNYNSCIHSAVVIWMLLILIILFLASQPVLISLKPFGLFERQQNNDK